MKLIERPDRKAGDDGDKPYRRDFSPSFAAQAAIEEKRQDQIFAEMSDLVGSER